MCSFISLSHTLHLDTVCVWGVLHILLCINTNTRYKIILHTAFSNFNHPSEGVELVQCSTARFKNSSLALRSV